MPLTTTYVSDSTATRKQQRALAAQAGLRLGERLRQLRVAAGMTQTDLAGKRFSKEYVSQIERGKTRPTDETIKWLAERLGVDAGFLANGVSADERGRVEAAIARCDALVEARRNDEALEEFDRVRSAVQATGLPELEVRALSARRSCGCAGVRCVRESSCWRLPGP
jgi:transcriptional regulator with XRE-family HTH domain